MAIDNIRGLGEYKEPKDYAIIFINSNKIEVKRDLTFSESLSIKKELGDASLIIRKEGFVKI
jgi:hypothetical protein